MKSSAGILMIMIMCCSCGSFNRVHYRHLNKVPAECVNYVSVVRDKSPGQIPFLPLEETKDSSCSGQNDTVITSDVQQVLDAPAVIPDERVVGQTENHATKFIVPVAARRDWSVGIALVMILAGILILLYCIFLLPYLNVILILILALEVLSGIAAFKLIARGVSIIRNRVRRPQSYKEADNRVK